jgi:hypothetical protein
MSNFLVGSKKRYVDTYVDLAYLEHLRKAMDDEHSPKKYSKYKAWLHYANLQSWQEQGWHFAYLNYMGKELHCTCGLVVPIGNTVTSDIKEGVRKRWAGLNLDRVQLQTGHRNLPSLIGTTTAILVNFKWIEDGDYYIWDGICQGCGEYLVEMKGEEIKKFLNNHKENC